MLQMSGGDPPRPFLCYYHPRLYNKELSGGQRSLVAAVHGITRAGHDLATEQQQQQQLVLV